LRSIGVDAVPLLGGLDAWRERYDVEPRAGAA
jgi:hypothetical protein